MLCDVLNLAGERVSSRELVDAVFNIGLNPKLVKSIVEWQLTKRRAGSASTRNRTEVEGTTKKSRKQKGTGGARHGSLRAMQFRGGATFGPIPRLYEYKLNKKVRALGLKMALSSVLSKEKISLIDSFKELSTKTAGLKKTLDSLLPANRRVLLVDGGFEEKVVKAAANLPLVDVLPVCGLNVYDLLRCDRLVLTVVGAEAIEGRFGNG